ncbi:MAG: hypothetical protein JWQ73_265 [Variovorax sp.]|nr:hypothetical protein [Variovorax sp.]
MTLDQVFTQVLVDIGAIGCLMPMVAALFMTYATRRRWFAALAAPFVLFFLLFESLIAFSP